MTALHECEERAWNLYWRRLGNPAEQASTALHLRSRLSGPAYKVVRKLRHQDLITRGPPDEQGQTEPTEDGVRPLLDALKGEVQDIASVRSNEIFDKALCGQTVWRGRNESMANFVARRRKEVAELKDDPDTIVIFEGIQSALVTFRSEGRELRTYAAELVDTSGSYEEEN